MANGNKMPTVYYLINKNLTKRLKYKKKLVKLDKRLSIYKNILKNIKILNNNSLLKVNELNLKISYIRYIRLLRDNFKYLPELNFPKYDMHLSAYKSYVEEAINKVEIKRKLIYSAIDILDNVKYKS